MSYSAISILAILLSISFGSGLVQAANSSSSETSPQPVRFEEVFVPEGYDSNDNVQIMAEGTFANGCWHLTDTPAAIDLNQHTITLKPTAAQKKGFCAQSGTRFQELIQLGPLAAGRYLIYQGESQEPVGELNVSAATTESVDDHVYAPVSRIDFRSENHGSGIRLTGQFPSSCMEVEDVAIKIQNNVIVLQPIVSIKGDVACKSGNFPFKAITYLDFMRQGRYLLHVRTMNGQAINRIVEIQ